MTWLAAPLQWVIECAWEQYIDEAIERAGIEGRDWVLAYRKQTESMEVVPIRPWLRSSR